MTLVSLTPKIEARRSAPPPAARPAVWPGVVVGLGIGLAGVGALLGIGYLGDQAGTPGTLGYAIAATGPVLPATAADRRVDGECLVGGPAYSQARCVADLPLVAQADRDREAAASTFGVLHLPARLLVDGAGVVLVLVAAGGLVVLTPRGGDRR